MKGNTLCIRRLEVSYSGGSNRVKFSRELKITEIGA